MYRDDSVIFDRITDTVLRAHPVYPKRRRLRHKKRYRKRLFAQTINRLPKKRVCALDLYADIHYTKAFGTLGAIAEMLITVREVNAIFARIDFDNDEQPDNIGVSAAKWSVTDSKLNTTETDGGILLRKFQRRLTDQCLQVLFTHQNLKYSKKGIGITGLANLKGVCHKQRVINGILQSPNSLLVSSLSNNRVVNRVQRIIDLTHEIGHSFGAGHDNEDFEGNTICNPSVADGGAFVMSTIHEDTAYQVSDLRNKQKFSSCSKRIITRVLSDADRSDCFTLRPEAKCGDLEVNNDEECDAGSEHISRFADPCCEPPGSPSQCRVKKGIECHPREGSCCDLKTCKFFSWKAFAENCRIDCWEPALCLGKSAKCPVRTPLSVGSVCFNCSSDDCICDSKGICRNRQTKQMTTTAKSIDFPTPGSTWIQIICKVIFSLFIALIIIAIVVFGRNLGSFEYICNQLKRNLFYRRGRRNRLLEEELPLQDLDDSDDSQH